MSDVPPPPDECANCGAAIPRGAKSCPECGADERTGWRETSVYDGMELPDAAWRDDGDAEEPASEKRTVNGLAWYWWAVGILVLFLIVGAFLGLR